MPRLYLRPDLQSALTVDVAPVRTGDATAQSADVFDALWRIRGKVYRRTASRRTMRWETQGRAYFVKLHDGVGWREIVKNLVVLKMPIVSARNEFRACLYLAEADIRAPRVAGFGIRGRNPATLKSFVVCDALEDFVSLEEVVARWQRQPPSLERRRRLVAEVARFTRRLHAAGVNHRDYYLGHLYVRKRQDDVCETELAVIDLHRAGLRRRIPNRWLSRDLGALAFSSADFGLTKRDWFRFVRDYAGERPAAAIRARPNLWKAVLRRANRLAKKGRRDSAARPL